MGADKPSNQPEVATEVSNDFAMETSAEAKQLMSAWSMKIEGNSIVINGTPAMFDWGVLQVRAMIYGLNSLNITAEGDTLTVVETWAEGGSTTYKGKKPQDIVDAMTYVGIVHMVKNPPRPLNLNAEDLDQAAARMLDLETKHPEYKEEYKEPHK